MQELERCDSAFVQPLQFKVHWLCILFGNLVQKNNPKNIYKIGFRRNDRLFWLNRADFGSNPGGMITISKTR